MRILKRLLTGLLCAVGLAALAAPPPTVLQNGLAVSNGFVLRSGAFTGDASGATNLDASKLASGALPQERLPGNVLTNNEANQIRTLARPGFRSYIDPTYVGGDTNSFYLFGANPSIPDFTIDYYTAGVFQKRFMFAPEGQLAASGFSDDGVAYPGTNNFSHVVIAPNANNILSGNGAGLTSLNAGNLGSGFTPLLRMGTNAIVIAGNNITIVTNYSGGLLTYTISGNAGSGTGSTNMVDGTNNYTVIVNGSLVVRSNTAFAVLGATDFYPTNLFTLQTNVVLIGDANGKLAPWDTNLIYGTFPARVATDPTNTLKLNISSGSVPIWGLWASWNNLTNIPLQLWQLTTNYLSSTVTNLNGQTPALFVPGVYNGGGMTITTNADRTITMSSTGTGTGISTNGGTGTGNGFTNEWLYGSVAATNAPFVSTNTGGANRSITLDPATGVTLNWSETFFGKSATTNGSAATLEAGATINAANGNALTNMNWGTPTNAVTTGNGTATWDVSKTSLSLATNANITISMSNPFTTLQGESDLWLSNSAASGTVTITFSGFYVLTNGYPCSALLLTNNNSKHQELLLSMKAKPNHIAVAAINVFDP